MPTALITGISGQDGVYLTRLLQDRGYDVVGLVQPGVEQAADQQAISGARLIPGDLRDVDSLVGAIDLARPDEVYNLAGISSVAQSWEDPGTTADVNAMGVLRLLAALKEHSAATGRTPRMLQASSAEMFGTPDVTPQDESTPLRPRNPYAVAKAFAHEMVATYRSGHGLFASSVILYNHESPLRPERFVTRKISRAVAAISLGLADSLVLGDLDSRRDWGHAADVVEAMWLALQHDEPDDFVVATGEAHSVREFVAAAFDVVGVSDWERFVTSDPQFRRPTEAPLLVGAATHARKVLGWTPQRTFRDVVAEMVEHDLDDFRARRGKEA